MASAKFIVYDKTTGEILRSGSCSSTLVELQSNSPDEISIEAEGSDATHYVDVTQLFPIVKLKEE